MYPSPTYRIIIRKFTGPYDFSPGPVLAEIENFYNLGWADYVNDVPEAFFTMLQEDGDSVLGLLRDYEGRAHVEIRRNDAAVFRGWLLESDANATDVVFYCYGYLAGLYWSDTAWGTEYVDKTIAHIVSTEWQAVKDEQVGGQYVSLLRWINNGSIQSPYTTTGSGVEVVLPNYKVHHKRMLFMLRELAAIGMSDTQQTTTFKINPLNNNFEFLRHSAVDRPNITLEWGDDQVANFRHLRAAVHKRTRLHGVGSNPQNVALRHTWIEPGSVLQDWGIRSEPVYLSWVRDDDNLIRVISLRGARARRIDNDLMIRLHPNSQTPPYYGSGIWQVADRCKVRIARGVTNIDNWFTLVGAQTYVGRGGVERLTMMLQETVGV